MIGEELLVQRAGAGAWFSQEPSAVRQTDGFRWSIRCGWIVGRSNADDPVIHQRLGEQPLIAGRLARDGHIGRVAQHTFEYVLTVADDQR